MGYNDKSFAQIVTRDASAAGGSNAHCAGAMQYDKSAYSLADDAIIRFTFLQWHTTLPLLPVLPCRGACYRCKWLHQVPLHWLCVCSLAVQVLAIANGIMHTAKCIYTLCKLKPVWHG